MTHLLETLVDMKVTSWDQRLQMSDSQLLCRQQ